MLKLSDVVYRYDGSFEGLLCCVFESYSQNEMPMDILNPDEMQQSLLPEKWIDTDEDKAQRVFYSIPKKMGPEALRFIQKVFLSSATQKERAILKFMRLGYEKGRKVMLMLSHEDVYPMVDAAKYIDNETHLLLGFLRFSVHEGVLFSQIEPRNSVLPMIQDHFCRRYPNESFVIYDKTHDMAFFHHKGERKLLYVQDFQLPDADAEENEYRSLWQMFYDTIAVEGRENPKCRMNHMPKRYWGNMTEFTHNDEQKRLKEKEQIKLQ